MKITYFGTTTLLFDDGQDQILFDCHITRPSLPVFLFGRLRTDTALADRLLLAHGIGRLRAIFISHSHHDHVMDAPYIAWKCGADIYGTESTLNVARGGSVREPRLHHFEKQTDIGAFSVQPILSIHSKPNLFNNDIGQTIDRSVIQPARRQDYREGGSYDFLVTHEGKRYLIRPSFNCLKGQLDGVRANVLFQSVAGLSRADGDTVSAFFRETVEKTGPECIIPIHWDNFFRPLSKPVRAIPWPIDDTGKSMRILADYCAAHRIQCLVQLPLTTIDL